MQVRLFNWLGREFIEVSGEGKSGIATDTATEELFDRFTATLEARGFSLNDAVRVRVWGRDKDGRTRAAAARSRILAGNRRVASSSFISQEWFESDATAGLELMAMKPTISGAERRPVDFDPVRNYLCYLEYDSVVFFSGFTSEAPTLRKQVREILTTLDDVLARARTDWSTVMKLSVLLQRGHDLETVRGVLASSGRLTDSEIEYGFVDGFAGEKYLLEIEATALRNL